MMKTVTVGMIAGLFLSILWCAFAFAGGSAILSLKQGDSRCRFHEDSVSGVRTDVRVSGSMGLWGDEHEPPTVRTEAWLWRLPEEDDLLSPISGNRENDCFFQWKDLPARHEVDEKADPRLKAFPPMKSRPGFESAFVAPDKEGAFALSVTAVVHRRMIRLRPVIETETEVDGKPAVRRILLPEVAVLEKGRRLIDLSGYQLPELAEGPTFLELRPTLTWDEDRSRVRQEDYTGSWKDRLDIGGEMTVEGFYYNGVKGD